ncbi:MAG: hypothetical protein R2762_22615 [Bryobacteraceae bacterium]
MWSLGLPEFFVIGGVLLFVAIPVLVALRAKPLGPMPYRWGCFAGIMELLNWPGDEVPTIVLILMAAVSGGAGVGLLMRRRWGVILFLASAAMFVISGAYSEKTQGLAGVAVLLASLLIVGLSVIYFKKRWHLMSGPPGA